MLTGHAYLPFILSNCIPTKDLGRGLIDESSKEMAVRPYESHPFRSGLYLAYIDACRL